MTGYYSFIPKSEFCAFDRYFIAYVSHDDKDDLCYEEIDPATVEPVAAKVVTEKHKMNEIAGDSNDWWITHYYCPDCGNTLQQKRERIDVNGNIKYTETIKRFKYCVDCGQRIDWSDLLKEGADE